MVKTKLIKLTSEQIEEFYEYDKWSEMASNCDKIRDSPYASIPVMLPSCSETNDVCTFENCPKNKVQEKCEK